MTIKYKEKVSVLNLFNKFNMDLMNNSVVKRLPTTNNPEPDRPIDMWADQRKVHEQISTSAQNRIF
jgi:hypothetical protein